MKYIINLTALIVSIAALVIAYVAADNVNELRNMERIDRTETECRPVSYNTEISIKSAEEKCQKAQITYSTNYLCKDGRCWAELN